MADTTIPIRWQLTSVKSPRIPEAVQVIAAKDIPYFPNANKLQNLSIYLPFTSATSSLVGTIATSLPGIEATASSPNWLVHIHGGAWRDIRLTSSTIEATVAHAFNPKSNNGSRLAGLAALNYTLSPTQSPDWDPYDPVKDNHTHPEREAVHPTHVRDVLHGLKLLRSLGLKDDTYILSGHSAGACLCCQAVLQPPQYYGLGDLPDPPRPAALVGLNGLYDLEQLVHGLGPSHAHLKNDYCDFLSLAFGADQSAWPAESPARFDVDDIAQWVEEGKAPRVMVLDQSVEDQLVPMNQIDRMVLQMQQVSRMKVVLGKRCVGEHAAPWKEGWIIWESVLDVLRILKEER